MKRTALPLLFLLAAAAMGGTKASVQDLLTSAAKFDGKNVTVVGTVDKFEAKTSRSGNKYFVFKLKEKGNELNVYGRGELKKAPKDGDKVEITGRYAKEKKMRDFTVKNEVDVSPKPGEKNGVKILAPKK